jgi:predicted membrane protein
MINKAFFAGSEEVIARLVSLFISLLFFAIYMVAKVSVVIDMYRLLTFLSIFWVVYEILAYILFMIFKFFSKAEEKMVSAEPNLQQKSSASTTATTVQSDTDPDNNSTN